MLLPTLPQTRSDSYQKLAYHLLTYLLEWSPSVWDPGPVRVCQGLRFERRKSSHAGQPGEKLGFINAVLVSD